MSIQRSLVAFVVGFTVLFAGSAMAGPIAVPNYSFENPVLPIRLDPDFTLRDLPGWTKDFEDTDDLGDDNQAWGATNPSLSHFGSLAPLPSPFDANQLAYNNLLPGDSTSLVTADPATVLNAGDMLMLEVAVGNRNASTFADIQFEVGLSTASGMELGTFASTTLEPTGETEVLTYLLDVDAEASAQIGQGAFVRLRGINIQSPVLEYQGTFGQAFFDNVKLSAVPEPNGIAILLPGFIGLLWRRRRFC